MGVADDACFIAARRPADDDLRFGKQERLDPVRLGPQGSDLVAGGCFLLGGARARAHQHDGGRNRDAEHAERQGERGALMRVEARERAEIDVDERY